LKVAPVISALVDVPVMALVSLDALAATAPPAGRTVSLRPSAPTPQLVGDRLTWTATAARCGAAPVYQFDVAAPAEGREGKGLEQERGRHPFSVVRDSSTNR
jgi:hypothetical protein